MGTISKNHMAELLAKAREKKIAEKVAELRTPATSSSQYPFAPVIEKEPEPEPPKKLSANSAIEKLRAKLQEEKEKKSEQLTLPVTNSTDTGNSSPSLPTTNPAHSEAESKGTEQILDGTVIPATATETVDKYGNAITYNEQQQEFVNLVASGQSCVLIGAAGTGKTTCSQGAIQQLLQTGKVPVLQAGDHKHLISGTPGIVIIAYTRRAVNNIKRVLPPDLKPNCITAHKLLEYSPVYYEIADPETGDLKKTMKFEPLRHLHNPLPDTIHTVIVEESSMMGTDLYAELNDALPHPVQWIFLGDIQQLPPVFGPAILGFKMLELPVIELTQVYRQALESPIIRLAHQILSGTPIPLKELPDWHVPGKLTLHPWKKKLHPDTAVMTLAAFFTKALDTGNYNPDEDIILIPFNKACGTVELNKYIANHIARKNGEVTYEVMAGFNKHYFSVGDRVLYDKEDAEIVEISYNASYTGARVQPESKTLDYWGHNPNLASDKRGYDYGDGNDDVDFLLAQVDSGAEDRVTQSSHVITVKLLDTGAFLKLTKAADVNALLHSYALTVHKAQGSEWRKVFLTLHQSHATMLQRELLYTAVTRAREELYVICEPESFVKGITSQRIKGNTLAEKAEYFKGKYSAEDVTYILARVPLIDSLSTLRDFLSQGIKKEKKE